VTADGESSQSFCSKPCSTALASAPVRLFLLVSAPRAQVAASSSDAWQSARRRGHRLGKAFHSECPGIEIILAGYSNQREQGVSAGSTAPIRRALAISAMGQTGQSEAIHLPEGQQGLGIPLKKFIILASFCQVCKY
jgi:hypothetical protein